MIKIRVILFDLTRNKILSLTRFYLMKFNTVCLMWGMNLLECIEWNKYMCVVKIDWCRLEASPMRLHFGDGPEVTFFESLAPFVSCDIHCFYSLSLLRLFSQTFISLTSHLIIYASSPSIPSLRIIIRFSTTCESTTKPKYLIHKLIIINSRTRILYNNFERLTHY